MTKRYRQAVAALVLRKDPEGQQRFLLVHKPRIRDEWQLPQGGIEEGETLTQAALRELQEETSLVLPSIERESDRTYTYDFPPEFIARHQPVNHGQQLSFVIARAPQDAQIIVDQHEIDGFAWVTIDELHHYIPRPEYLTCIQDLYRDAVGTAC